MPVIDTNNATKVMYGALEADKLYFNGNAVWQPGSWVINGTVIEAYPSVPVPIVSGTTVSEGS